MSDSDLQHRKPRERSVVDLHGRPETVRYWTTELRCTEAALRDAVSKVGTLAEDVRKHLDTLHR